MNNIKLYINIIINNTINKNEHKMLNLVLYFYFPLYVG